MDHRNLMKKKIAQLAQTCSSCTITKKKGKDTKHADDRDENKVKTKTEMCCASHGSGRHGSWLYLLCYAATEGGESRATLDSVQTTQCGACNEGLHPGQSTKLLSQDRGFYEGRTDEHKSLPHPSCCL